MASEAAGIDFFGGVIGEYENFGFVATPGYVSSPGPVATFATLMRRASLRIQSCFPVR